MEKQKQKKGHKNENKESEGRKWSVKRKKDI